MAKWEQTLVVDFDDTIAFTTKRDWYNALPNQPLIDKLNDLYKKGWDIHIVTARGTLSCKNREEAERTYRPQIEDWLDNNRVSYTSLCFQKKLGLYYIDDKGITPDDFVENFEIEELEGWSGATVYIDKSTGDVVKIHEEYPGKVVEWYEAAEDRGFKVPKIRSLIGNTIKMERLFSYLGTPDGVIQKIMKFDGRVPIEGYQEPPMQVALYRDYIERCKNRIPDSEARNEINKFLDKYMLKEYENTPYTFGHGDASFENIMSDKYGKEVYFIDPIQEEGLYSSWVIDLAKYYASLALKSIPLEDRVIERNLVKNHLYKNINIRTIQVHAIAHLCRMYPYADKYWQHEILLKITELCEKVTNKK
jgi:capsule biosynthesis phosphatase